MKQRFCNRHSSDISDEEWAFATPYLTLMVEEAWQREDDLQEVYSALCWIAAGVFEAMVHDLRVILRLEENRAAGPSAVIVDSRTLRSTPESGARTGHGGHKRKRGSKIHAAVDALGQLLALHVTPANEQDCAQIGQLIKAVRRPRVGACSWPTWTRAIRGSRGRKRPGATGFNSTW